MSSDREGVRISRILNTAFLFFPSRKSAFHPFAFGQDNWRVVLTAENREVGEKCVKYLSTKGYVCQPADSSMAVFMISKR